MRKLILAAALALSLPACTTIPTAPVDVANQTVVDEQAALSVELAYQAAALAVTTAAKVGALKGENAAKAAELDNKAYSAVLAVRRAYDTGNATSYAAAASTARSDIAALLALVK